MLCTMLLENTRLPQCRGSRDGTVVRALASHQCGLGSIPGLGVMCGVSLLLVLVLAPRRFLRFSSLLKNQDFQIQIRFGIRRTSLSVLRLLTVTLVKLKSIYFLLLLKHTVQIAMFQAILHHMCPRPSA